MISSREQLADQLRQSQQRHERIRQLPGADRKLAALPQSHRIRDLNSRDIRQPDARRQFGGRDEDLTPSE